MSKKYTRFIDVIKKSGSFYSFGETKLEQGRENVKNFLAENPALASEIEEIIKNSI